MRTCQGSRLLQRWRAPAGTGASLRPELIRNPFGGLMITLSENASKELEAFFTAHDDVKKSIRIFFAPGG